MGKIHVITLVIVLVLLVLVISFIAVFLVVYPQINGTTGNVVLDDRPAIVKTSQPASSSPINTQNNINTPADSSSCRVDSDCVPSNCCHPSSCVNANQKPDCDGARCTMDCSGPLDCGVGYCGCLNEQCQIIEQSKNSNLLYVINDGCSFVSGNLIHAIGNSEDCQLRCRTRCELENLKYDSSNLIIKENDCNICNCYCN